MEIIAVLLFSRYIEYLLELCIEMGEASKRIVFKTYMGCEPGRGWGQAYSDGAWYTLHV